MSTASLRVVGHECHTPLQNKEVLHLYRWYRHLPRSSGAVDERKMRVRWEWKWDDSYLKGTQDGERKRRKEKWENTNTTTHLAQSGQTLKGQGKRKNGRTNIDQRRGGRTEAPDTTYKARAKPTSAVERPKPDLTQEHAWNRGPMGNKLVRNDASTNKCKKSW